MQIILQNFRKQETEINSFETTDNSDIHGAAAQYSNDKYNL